MSSELPRRRAIGTLQHNGVVQTSFNADMVAMLTILRKEVTRFLRIWSQTLLPSVITMSLYFVIFGTVIGSRISNMGSFSYISFIAPGIIMMAIITNAYSNVASSFFGMKFQRSIEEILVSPTPVWAIILGFVLGGVARGLVVALLVSLVALFFTHITLFNVGYVVVFALLTSLVFSLAGLINGIFARKFDDVSIIPTFVLTPLSYLGGVFYSVSLLPEPWHTISLFNPILYMVNGFRYGFLGYSDVNIYVGLVFLVLCVIGLSAVAYIFIKKGKGLRS